jgi:hypothetical protein
MGHFNFILNFHFWNLVVIKLNCDKSHLIYYDLSGFSSSNKTNEK